MSWAALQWAETVELSINDDGGKVDGARLTAARLVLMLLARRANDCGHCWPSQAAIAEAACRSERRLRDVVQLLQTNFYIDRRARNFYGQEQRSDIYEVMFPGRFTVKECPSCAVWPVPDILPPGIATRLPERPARRTAHRTTSSAEERTMPSGENRTTSSAEHLLNNTTSLDNQSNNHREFPAHAYIRALREAPGYDLGSDREAWIVAAVTELGATDDQALVTATALAAKWEGYRRSTSNRRGYVDIALTFRNWLTRDTHREGASREDAPTADPLDAYRKSYGRYLKPQEANT